MHTKTRKTELGKWVFFLLSCVVFAVHCSDAKLYSPGLLDASPDRLAVTGRVCTDDPQGASFPVRVVFIVDQANGPLFSSYDPEQIRIRQLNDTLSIHEGNTSFSFAVVGMGPVPRLYAPDEGYFTRNTGELAAAISALSLPTGCINERCRNYEDALFTAQSLIEGDLADMNAGEQSRTQYVVVLMAGGEPAPLLGDWPETITSLQQTVNELKESVEADAASFSLHTLHLAPQDSPQETEQLLREMAFAGNGKYERFNSADAITLDHVGLLKLTALFEAKSLVVANVNAISGTDGSILDSDGDGLSDAIERKLGTDIRRPDTDGDGIGDLVETLILSDPLNGSDTESDSATDSESGAIAKPEVCRAVPGPPYTDIDSDRLNDCEELLVGTDFSLPDSDGDGITDWMELTAGTDYLYYDYLEDADWDGVNNGDEVAHHTDPRTNDAASHLAGAYRYEITDEGVLNEYVVAQPGRVLGVEILEAGQHTTGGVGTLRFIPDPPRLLWKDASDTEAGPGVVVSAGGEYVLYAASYVPPGQNSNNAQNIGDGEADTLSVVTANGSDEDEGVARWVRVYVTPSFLPPQRQDDYLLVQAAQRHCISFTVRNIQLVETIGNVGNEGLNNIFVYFSQAPAGDMMLPGIYRVAHIPVTYTQQDGRTPKGAVLELRDDDFMTIGY